MAGEGIEYDGGLKDRLVVSSRNTGAIRGVPNTLSSAVLDLSEANTYTYFQGGGSIPIGGTLGMHLDPENVCWLWAAVRTTPTGGNPYMRSAQITYSL